MDDDCQRKVLRNTQTVGMIFNSIDDGMSILNYYVIFKKYTNLDDYA